MKKIFRSVSYGLDMPISIGRSNLILYWETLSRLRKSSADRMQLWWLHLFRSFVVIILARVSLVSVSHSKFGENNVFLCWKEAEIFYYKLSIFIYLYYLYYLYFIINYLYLLL